MMKTFAMFLIIFAISLSAHAEIDIAGEWVNYDNLGVQELPNSSGGHCVVRVIEERRYNFYRLPDIHTIRHGVYSNNTHWVWLIRDRDDCAAPGQRPANIYLTLRLWNLDFEPGTDKTRLEAIGKFDSCVGAFCNTPGMFKDNFTVNLSISAGMITDAGDGRNVGRLTFVPIDTLKNETYSIVTSFLVRLKNLTPSTEDAFVDDAVDPNLVQREGRTTVIALLHQYYIERLAGGSEFEIIEAIMMPPKTAPFLSPPLIYVTMSHKPVSGQNLLERLELVLSNGRWYIALMP